MGKKNMDCEIKGIKKNIKNIKKTFISLEELIEKLHKIVVEQEAGKLSIAFVEGGELSIINKKSLERNYD